MAAELWLSSPPPAAGAATGSERIMERDRPPVPPPIVSTTVGDSLRAEIALFAATDGETDTGFDESSVKEPRE